MSLTGRRSKPTVRQLKVLATKAVVALSTLALLVSTGSAQADSLHPTPKPSPTQHTTTDKKSVDDYLAKRNVAVAASRARKASSLRIKIANTRRQIATARVNGTQILRIAAKYKGVPYRYGGSTPSGFDCSGYTSYVFRQAGIELPRIAQGQLRWSKRITAAQAKPGDLAFYLSGTYAYHVAIYAGDGMIWHSPRPGEKVKKVKIRNHKMAYGRIPASAIVPGLLTQLNRDTKALAQLVKPAKVVKK